MVAVGAAVWEEDIVYTRNCPRNTPSLEKDEVICGPHWPGTACVFEADLELLILVLGLKPRAPCMLGEHSGN